MPLGGCLCYGENHHAWGFRRAHPPGLASRAPGAVGQRPTSSSTRLGWARGLEPPGPQDHNSARRQSSEPGNIVRPGQRPTLGQDHRV